MSARCGRPVCLNCRRCPWRPYAYGAALAVLLFAWALLAPTGVRAQTCPVPLVPEPSPSPTPAPVTATGQPNIVLVLVDDAGVSDFDAMPSIQAIANEGVRFENAYAYQVCSASRGLLLTGRQPKRYSLTYVISPTQTKGVLPPTETTLAQTLQAVGYSTAAAGKWHLSGANTSAQPLDFGFSSASWSRNSRDQYPLEWWSGRSLLLSAASHSDPNWQPLCNSLTSRETDAALAFLSTAPAPRFLYVATSGLHTPHCHATTLPGETAFQADVRETDALIAQVLATVSLSDTQLWVVSDNGSPVTGHNGIFRGGKEDYYEGGIHVPMVAAGVGISGPRSVPDVVSLEDLFTTLTLIGGGVLPGGRIIDGHDVRPVLDGSGPAPHKTVWRNCAYIDWPFKLVADPCSATPPWQLFDLSADPGETTPLDNSTLLQDMLNRKLQEAPKAGS